MNKLEVAELFMRIKQAYSNFETDKDKREYWHGFLADTPSDVVYTNLRNHIASEKFPPTIAELKGLHGEGNSTPSVDETKAYLEWKKEMVRKHQECSRNAMEERNGT